MCTRLGGVSVGFGCVKLTVALCIALVDLGVQPSFGTLAYDIVSFEGHIGYPPMINLYSKDKYI